MADNNSDLKQTEKIAAALQEQSAKTSDGLDKLQNKTTKATKTFSLLEKQLKAIKRSQSEYNSELESTNLVLAKNEKLIETATDMMVDYSLKGRKGAIGVAIEVKRAAANMADLAKETMKTSATLDSQSKSYTSLLGKIVENAQAQTKLNDNIKKNIGNIGEQKKALESLVLSEKEYKQDLHKLELQLELTTEALHNQNKELVDSHQKQINSIKNAGAQDRALAKMQGGVKALTADLSEMADNKLWSLLEDNAGYALMVKGLTMMNSATADAGKLYKTNRALARQFGEDAKSGFTAYSDSVLEATKTATTFKRTAAALGMEEEELIGIGDKLRLQVKAGAFGAEGKRGEETIRGLTREVAYFSKETGVDADSAIEMLERRMKTMGMNAQEAGADLASVTTVIKQMQIGLKPGVIDMGEMSKMIEQASTASESYIVDTRLMTQVMRAAAVQSQELGGSQKAQKSAAEAMGKISAGKTGQEWMDVTSGMDLAKTLRDAPEEILKNLTGEKRKLIEGIKKELDSGKIGIHQAGLLLMEEMGGTDAALEAKMSKISLIGKGPERYNIIARQLNISNDAARVMVFQMEKAQANRERMQKALKGEKSDIGLSELMANRAEMTNKALEGLDTQDQKVSALTKTMGLTRKEALEYLKVQGTGDELWAKQTKFLADKLDPNKKSKTSMDQLKVLQKQGKSSDEMKTYLKEQYGISEDNTDALKLIDDATRQGGDQLQQTLIQLQQTQNAAKTEEQKNLEDFYDKMDKGILGGIKAEIESKLGFGGPIVIALAGLAAAMGGIGLKLYGTSKLTTQIGEALAKRGVGKIPGFGGFGAGKEIAKTAETEVAKTLEGAAAKGIGKSALLKTGGKYLGTAALIATQAYTTREEFKEIEKSNLSTEEKIRAKQKSAGKGVGGVAGSLAGAALGAKGGALGGAAIGSIFPGPGTVIGGAVGGFLGGLGGGIGGALGGGALGGKSTEMLQGSLPEGGNINKVSMQQVEGMAEKPTVQSQRPNLSYRQTAASNVGPKLVALPDSFNSAEDSVLVKWHGIADLFAMIQKKSVNVAGSRAGV